MKKTNNTLLIQQLKSSNSKENQAAFFAIYQDYFSMIFHLVTKKGGTAIDVEDVFQEGIVILWQQIRKNLIKDENKIGSYFSSVCRNIWLGKLRRQPFLLSLTEQQLDVPSPERNLEAIYQAEDQNALSVLMSQLRAQYRQVLIYFYYDHLPMKEISHKMGFSSVQVAKNTKYRAIKQLKALIQNSGFSEQLQRA